MKPVDIFAKNLAKIEELQEFCRWPVTQWLGECFSFGLPCLVAETFRSQARQNELWLIGRRGIAGEEKRTWTLTSQHTLRLAVDVLPSQVNIRSNRALTRTFLDQVAQIGEKYGIYRPPELVKKGDLGHFQTDRAVPIVAPVGIDAQKRFATRAIKRLSGEQKERAVSRFFRTFGVLPVL